MTLPQVNYYLKKCNKHIEFTIKVQTMSFGGGLFGGSSEPVKEGEEIQREDGTYLQTDSGEYKVADASDMDWLSSIL